MSNELVLPVEKTKVMVVTACRCYLGQTVIEVPVWVSEPRIRDMIRHGGELARYFSRNVQFDRIEGTGLARCTVTDWKPHRFSSYREPPQPEHLFSDISGALRADGLIF